eukprot:1962123-Pyramimonas_sp.AAC.1
MRRWGSGWATSGSELSASSSITSSLPVPCLEEMGLVASGAAPSAYSSSGVALRPLLGSLPFCVSSMVLLPAAVGGNRGLASLRATPATILPRWFPR